MQNNRQSQVFPSIIMKENQKPGKGNEDDDYENKVTIRLILEKFLNSIYGKYIETISAYLSFFSSILFIVSTYTDEGISWLDTLDIIIMSFFFGEYLIRLIAAPHPIHYIIGVWSIVDLSTIIPLFFIQEQSSEQIFLKFLNISRILRMLRVVRYINKYYKTADSEFSSVSKQIYIIFLTVITLIIVTAGILLTFEAPKRLEMLKLQDLNNCDKAIVKATFHEQVYFVVVTLATVGYGDVVPNSEEGRVCVIILIVIVIVLIPKQTNELIRLMGMQSVYARAFYKYNPEVPHIIICGHVEVSALKFFCNELFHPDHGGQDKHAIILQHVVPNNEMEMFLHKPQFEMFLTYLQGNPMLERDLKRSTVTQAKACVLLTNKNISDSHSADHKNILTGLAIKKYVDHMTHGENNIRLCMQLIKPESKTHYYSALSLKSNDQLIVVEEFKMNLLAKSCFCPGIISLLANLIASAGEMDEDDIQEEWLKEYTRGMGHEIYRTDLSSKFEGKIFSETAAIIYNEFQGILFGIELDVKGETIIRLNPGSYVIPNTAESNVHVYIICEDKKVADLVATYDMTQEEIAQYHQVKAQRNKKNEQSKINESGEYQQVNDDDYPQLNKLGKINLEENEIIESDYVLNPEPISLMSVTPISIKDSTEITNHIVLCGIHPSIYYFILPLRAKYLKEWQYIVILSEEKPTKIWDYINRFPKIIYIKGSPLVQEDLMRANINFADKAVILAQVINEKYKDSSLDEMLDAESIFIYKAIKKINKNVQIMIELVYPQNIEFLLPKEYSYDSDIKPDLTPLFSSGEVYISTTIDTLTCQTFYNPHILTILQQILTGGKQSNAVIKAICDHADLQQSNLWQIPVPEDYFNKTFGQLFNYLSIERSLIPLALYRLPGALDNVQPYTYTNPAENTKLTHRDKVFVLAYDIPNDLGGAQIQDKQKQQLLQTISNAGLQQKQMIQESQKKWLNDKKATETISQIDKQKKTAILKKQEVIQENKQNKNQLDLENLNLNSATYLVLDQVNGQIQKIKEELNQIKSNIQSQNEEILSKVRVALRQELATLTQ